jgi:hypothetical protein
MDFFVPNGGGGLTAPFHLTFGVGPSSVLTYTSHRDCLHNADDPGMRWQIEGGKVLENDKHVANYSSVKRVSCGTTEQNNCPTVGYALLPRWEAAREHQSAWCP